MKTIYFIGGPMGVGKTTVCQILKKKLSRCVFLDGDWCWDMDPFVVTPETKEMALNNICSLLNRFLACTAFEHIVFCWVLQQQETWDRILGRLHAEGWKVVCVALTASPEELTGRLKRDIQAGLRTPDIIQRSLDRLPLYADLDAIQIDTSGMTMEEVAEAVSAME